MKKRSKYRPRSVNPEAWKIGIQGAMKLRTDDQLVRFGLVEGGVHAVATGTAKREEWQHLFDAVAMLEALGRVGPVRGGEEIVGDAQEAICNILDRRDASGSLALYPAELAALNTMLTAWGDALAAVTHSEYFKAEELVGRKVRHALTSREPNVRVVTYPQGAT
jgi:hypothetical protein